MQQEENLKQLSIALRDFRTKLACNKEPPLVYPQGLAKYRPDNWCRLESPDYGPLNVRIEQEVDNKVPAILHSCLQKQLHYRLLRRPRARYVMAGVSCLLWEFVNVASVTVDLHLHDTTIYEIHDWGYQERKVDNEKIGSIYLGPFRVNTQAAFVTPLSLLKLVATKKDGLFEGPGIEIIKRDEFFTFFEAGGYDPEEEDLWVPNRFLDFINDIGHGSKNKFAWCQALRALGILDEATLKIVLAKLKDLKKPVNQNAPAEAPKDQDKQAVVEKLMTLGWSMEKATLAVESVKFPAGTPADDKVKVILQQYSHTDSV